MGTSEDQQGAAGPSSESPPEKLVHRNTSAAGLAPVGGGRSAAGSVARRLATQRPPGQVVHSSPLSTRVGEVSPDYRTFRAWIRDLVDRPGGLPTRPGQTLGRSSALGRGVRLGSPGRPDQGAHLPGNFLARRSGGRGGGNTPRLARRGLQRSGSDLSVGTRSGGNRVGPGPVGTLPPGPMVVSCPGPALGLPADRGGAHRPSDVLAGAAVGCLVVTVCVYRGSIAALLDRREAFFRDYFAPLAEKQASRSAATKRAA